MKASLSTNRFQVIPKSHILMIIDHIWWLDNEREIMNWMNDGLPGGLDHWEGSLLVFDNDFDRINFLMRWGP
jgi:hypothetical protein